VNTFTHLRKKKKRHKQKQTNKPPKTPKHQPHPSKEDTKILSQTKLDNQCHDFFD